MKSQISNSSNGKIKRNGQVESRVSVATCRYASWWQQNHTPVLNPRQLPALFLILLLCLSLPLVQSRRNLAWQGSPERLLPTQINSAETFFRFAGLRFGDSLGDVVRCYGSPGNICETDRFEYHRYLGDQVVIGVSKATGRVAVVQVERDRCILGREIVDRIEDARLAFLGKPESRVRQVFGRPTEAVGGSLHYQFGSRDGPHGEVDFDCYPFEGGQCGMIIVYWFA